MSAKIQIVQGHIMEQPVDGIINLVSPRTQWNGPVDQAIRDRLGTSFHSRLREQSEKGFFNTTGQILIVKGKPNEKSIVFVCDDHNAFKPLSEVLGKAIELSYMCNIRTLAMTVVRQGAAFSRLSGNSGTYNAEKSLIEVLKALKQQVEISVVVKNDPELVKRMQGYLTK